MARVTAIHIVRVIFRSPKHKAKAAFLHSSFLIFTFDVVVLVFEAWMPTGLVHWWKLCRDRLIGYAAWAGVLVAYLEDRVNEALGKK